jgi:glycosyltransferase involved in cell wall biosynthesis
VFAAEAGPTERRSQRPAADGGPLVTVVIPTYHRPAKLVRAAESVLAQRPPAGELELVVVLSDPASADDRHAARELAIRDARVHVVEAGGPGPGAARNCGVAAARSGIIAFLDDDCVAEPGWLHAGVDALGAADLVQGTTLPMAAPASRWDRVIHVDHMTWFWEACNLFVRAELVARAGGFDEAWNPTGVAGRHFGEDVEWGWRLIRHGARVAFSSAAVARHEVEAQTYWAWLRQRSELRFFPLLLRVAPELRELRFQGAFFDRRHRTVVAAAGLAGAGAALAISGARRPGALLATGGAAVWLLHIRHARSADQLMAHVRELPRQLLTEVVEVTSLGTGSLRWRRLLL